MTTFYHFIDKHPTINLSKHCGSFFSGSANPMLLKCSAIQSAIDECHGNGKRVYISLGGATEHYGLKNADEAVLFAERIWDLFLGGQSEFRPFGEYALFF